MNKIHALFFGLAFIGGSMTTAYAQSIRGANGTITMPAPLKLNKKTLRNISPKGMTLRSDFVKANRQYFVLVFDDILNDETAQLVNANATFISYIPDNVYLYAAADAEAAISTISKSLNGKANLLSSGALPMAYKLIDELYRTVTAGDTLRADIVKNGIVVSTILPDDRTALEATLDGWDTPYEITPTGLLRLLEPTSELVARVATLPFVLYLYPYEEAQPLAFDMDYIMQPNRINIVNYDRKGPIGNGITFANWEPYGGENRWGISSFGRNISAYTDNSINAHGTDCGLIVSAADNLVEGSQGGMAPGVKIMAMNDTSHDIGLHLNGVVPALSAGYIPLVSNHSVGWSISPTQPDTYTDQSAKVDQITYAGNNYMCCYPTGNWAYGTSTYAPYTLPDYGRITGHIKTNKNGLAIHSTLYPGVDVTWANFGPTFDGRMKPDISAQGSGGTSYASPGVAGMMSVLLEQFKLTYPSLDHRVDVCKAVMLNTALDVRTYANGKEEGRGIDYRTGFGEINAPAAVDAIKEKRVDFERSVSTGGVDEKKITLPANQTELRVMLYWNDPAATAGAASALINDLDLEVVTPSGKVILPWTLDPTPANVDKPAQRVVNRRDNAEQVILTAATKDETLEAGEYTIRVKGHKVPRGPQNFVTTWQSRERGIRWTSIPEGYRVRPGQSIILSWDMTLSEAEEPQAPNFKQGAMTPKLYYRVSPSANWTLATADTGLQYWANVGGNPSGQIFGKNFFKWTVPETMVATANLQFRVVAGDLSAESNNAHVGEKLSGRPTILSFTPTKVKLSWPAAKKVTNGKYIIYALYDKYMEQVGETNLANTTAEITAPNGVTWNKDQFFSVAVFDNDKQVRGQRSLPVGFNPMNDETTDAENVWKPSYRLCVGDVLNLRANSLEGTVKWYRDGNLLTDKINARELTIPRTETGTYQYQILNSANEEVYASPVTHVQASTVELADTAQWGDYAWKGYVFNKPGGSPQSLPLLTDGLGLYGKFELNQFGFNSHTELFPWDAGKAHDIPGYEGCPTNAHNETVIVMKRKGFVPGSYTLNFKRASGIAQVFVYDGAGLLVRTSNTPVNAYNAAVTLGRLDENSRLEIHWTGSHLSVEPNRVFATGEAAKAPALVTPRPGFWLNPSLMEGGHGTEVKRIYDAYPQAETYSLMTATGAKVNTTGSNYNTTLDFEGVSGYGGGMRKFNETATAIDFLVVNAKSGNANGRIVSYGSGETDNGEVMSYTILMDANSYYASTRNAVTISQTKARAGYTKLLTVRRNATTANISVNGAEVVGTAAASTDNLALHRMTIGQSFKAAEPNFFKGQIGEIVHYDAALTAANENKVRTYLALKHGISLDHDYVLGTTTLYPAATTAYKYQITGIGRNDNSLFNQKQSRGQRTNGTNAQLILAIGDLMPTNAQNSAEFGTNLTYYVAGANSNNNPLAASGNASTVSYNLKSTGTAANDLLSFYLPSAGYVKTGMTTYLEFATTPLSGTEPAETSTLVELRPYTAADGNNYLRGDFAPTAADMYFRVVWKTTPASIADVLIDSNVEAVRYEFSSFVVNVKDAVSLDVIDLSGRTLRTELPVIDGRVKAVGLLGGVYMVRVLCADGRNYAVKVGVSE